MSRRLILPVNKARLTASMKTEAYRARFLCIHYGIDLVSAEGVRTVYASGDGLVLSAGTDNVVGNVAAVLYRDALNRRTGRTADLVLRYFHLASVSVKAGDKVTKDTRIGIYGNTGSMEMSPHLHLEADLDTAHPLYSPTVNRSGLLRGRSLGATDRDMANPVDWLYCKTSPPDNQSWSTAGDAYCRAEDRIMENIV